MKCYTAKSLVFWSTYWDRIFLGKNTTDPHEHFNEISTKHAEDCKGHVTFAEKFAQ